MRLLFYSILLILCISFCEHVEPIWIINYSNEGQILYYSCSDTIGSKTDNLQYAFFKHYHNNDRNFLKAKYYIAKLHYNSIPIFMNRKSIFNDCKDKRVRFYFISDSVFMKYTWDTIVKRQMYNKKLTYTEEQMDSLGWIIEYR